MTSETTSTPPPETAPSPEAPVGPGARVLAERVMRPRDFLAFAVLMGLNLCAIGYFLAYWFTFDRYTRPPIPFAIVSLLIAIVLTNYLGRWVLLLSMKRPVAPALVSQFRVAVATTFVPGAEGLGMLETTVRALVAIDYPHDTWVLDEGDDPEVKALCRRVGVRHFTRKSMPRYQAEAGHFASRTKYGNINAWLHEHGFERYDVVSLFDPDHVPLPSFLSRVLGYFEDPSIGYVQAAQAYYNQRASFIARGAAEETYAYNSSIQMAAYALGYPVIVGSHNTHRVAALKEIGGLAPHDADDVLTTLVYRSNDWQGVFVPEILARGLAPVDWSSYLVQQRRWARSVLDVKLRLQPRMSGKLTLATRTMSLLHGLNYLYRSYVILASVLILAFALVGGIGSATISHLVSPQLAALFGVLFACDFFRQRFYLDPRSERGAHWRVAVLHCAKWPYMVIALLDVLLRRRPQYEITPKLGKARRSSSLFTPHAIAAVMFVAAAIAGLLLGSEVAGVVYALAGLSVGGSLALTLSNLMAFPEPYDESLSPPRVVESAIAPSDCSAPASR